MTINAYAKINLTLDVVRKRDDGYHDVDMIMQTVGLCDKITVEKAPEGITLSGTGKNLPYDESNLAHKAAKLFLEESETPGGAKIHIEKNIPICAGLGGGSSDAAAVLCGLNELYGAPFSKDDLAKLGAKLGADVPFCILKGTASASGIGDVIKPLPKLPKYPVVLIKTEIDISTPWAYKSLDLGALNHPNTKHAVQCIQNGDFNTLWQVCGNAFESAVFKHYPEIREIKEKTALFGASLALMSGSGSTVFGIFEDEGKAKAAYDFFKDKIKETFLTSTIG